jgi:hypothetical protein
MMGFASLYPPYELAAVFRRVQFVLYYRHEKQTAHGSPRTRRTLARRGPRCACEIARDIEEGISKGDYEPTVEESAGIERGLQAAAEGRFATGEQVQATLARLRDA